ncbi:MAG: Holliday junction ATP-dependent DNA helicase RuvA [Phycisphaerales bacterium]|nr:Holliday junction ATP-dependent DNA helicase RuvA [Phycisphaerales bacterium]
MIHRVEGVLETVAGMTAIVRMPGGITLEVLVPAYLGRKLEARTAGGGGPGGTVSFLTHLYLEGQGQGASFIPRLIGFESALDRRFFELFTTVKGIGNRKALRALEVEPAVIARAVAEKDTRALVKLPEIGKRLAETIVAELHGKVDIYLGAAELAELKPGAEARPSSLPPGQQEAVEALVALGETRADAVRKVEQAVARHAGTLTTADEVLGAVYGG